MKNEINLLFYLIILLFITLTCAFISITNIENSVDEKAKSTQVISKPVELSHIEKQGKALFKANCATCHNSNMKSDMTGPALGGVLERWDNDTLEIAEFARNPRLYLDTKADKRLKDIRKKYGTDMQSFPNITNDEIKAIIAYIETRHSY